MVRVKKWKIITCGVSAVLGGALIAGNVMAKTWEKQITNVLCGTGERLEGTDVTEALAESDKLCQKISEDSITLLKNDGSLPLSSDTTNINLFGYGATDQGFLLKGIGSGSSTISNKKKYSLVKALEEEGFEVNKDVLAVYDGLTGVRPSNPDWSNVYNLNEPSVTKFDDLWDSAKEFSDVAIFVISRDGGENVGEIPKTQNGNSDKTYLEITTKEQEMLDLLKNKFGTVIVLLNTTNTMHTGFLEDDGISAALNVGILGQSGARAIGKVLNGTVNPSGKITDIMTYSPEYDPTFANNEARSGNITYAEDIYYGYKWYETADEENYFSEVNNTYGEGYDGIVQYPFGHGLSYTDFEQTIKSVSLNPGSSLEEDSEITVTVTVKNIGDVAGKDIVQLYYTAPYIDGEIEKSSINLLEFAKTALIPAGQSQDVELTFTTYDLASYDCYDKNGNTHSTYELDQGQYQIKLMKNSHELVSDTSVVNYNVDSDIIFENDPLTGNKIENRFTGNNAYVNTPIDGSTAGVNTTYMTRSDFEGTFPKNTSSSANGSIVNAAANYFHNEPYEDIEPITANIDRGLLLVTKEDGSKASYDDLIGKTDAELIFNEDLLQELADPESEKWDLLVQQMSKDELADIVELGGFHTQPVVSIGKPLFYDYDGPAGFNTNSQTGNWNGESPDTESWTAYPSEALMGCSWNKTLMFELGFSMGAEGNVTKINGWYAPGVNLHRSAYNSRNYEYYSEDGVLSGNLAAQVIKGAKSNGLYCYLKHFACSEEGPNPRDVNTWLTEQNLRENYLKPFEIAVKEGESNAIMTAFNRIGAVWAGANYALNVEILREEWGFRGSVITDYTEGGGVGGMNTRQGVRAGNDLWLNPKQDSINNPLNMSDNIDAYCAQQAAKNILFTYVDTWNYNYNFDDSELDGLNKVTINIAFKDNVFAWWWILVYVIDVLVYGTLLVSIVLIVLDLLKNKKIEEK